MTEPRAGWSEAGAIASNPEAMKEFEAVLAYLKQSRGVDFSAYKRSSLVRRFLVRMQAVDSRGFAGYQDFLQVDSNEFVRLFNTILINVTDFFRDPPAWEYLGAQVLPRLLEEGAPTRPVRVWSAGCSSGEEAYTIAMILVEAMGKEQFRDRVKIYATDIDEEALAQARQAIYDGRAVQGVPPELLDKYFEEQDGRYTFNREVRRSIIFGRHDLIQDAPISRVNLVICRNCLMYFNSEAQARIVARFRFALAEQGVLFLGKAETLLTHSSSFAPLDAKRRVFMKVERSAPDEGETVMKSARSASGMDQASSRRLQELAVELLPMPHLVVDARGTVVQISKQLRTLFGLSAADTGRPLQDLELSYRPFELRSSLEQALAEGRTVIQREGRWVGPGGQSYVLDVIVVPLPDGTNGYAGASIAFVDVTRQQRLQEEIQRTNQELETALEELQSTNEELETTNEELRSTVEELETTNEELQSTNEELGTMNQELQSTNQELHAANDDTARRNSELADLSAFLEAILASLRGALIMLDSDLSIQRWSRRCEELWGLRSEEVLRKNFLNLDSGIPVEQLREPIRGCLSGKSEHRELTVSAASRHGKPIQLKVTCTPLAGPADERPRGVIVMMEVAE